MGGFSISYPWVVISPSLAPTTRRVSTSLMLSINEVGPEVPKSPTKFSCFRVMQSSRLNVVAIGRLFLFANLQIELTDLSDQEPPPRRSNGLLLFDNTPFNLSKLLLLTSELSFAKFGIKFALVLSLSMSSGRAITTGPGLPDNAVLKALETISGIRSTLSIWVTHLAIVLNICL